MSSESILSCWESSVSFSRLLLIAANSKKCIRGKGNGKVCISPKLSKSDRYTYEGEVILCFQLDDQTDQGKRVPHGLGIPKDSKRCDGLVFYSQDDKPDRVICLVEMKSTEIIGAAEQIISTKSHIKDLLRKECEALPEECRPACEKQIVQIQWKACLYHTGASQNEVNDFLKELKKSGFVDVDHLDPADNDLRPLLSGEGRSPKEMAMKFKGGKKQKRNRK